MFALGLASYVAASLFLLGVVGAGTLAVLGSRHWRSYLPALPALGIATTSVIQLWLILAFPVKTGAWILLVVSGALLAYRAVRARRTLRSPSRRWLRGLAVLVVPVAAVLIAAAPARVALAPQISLRDPGITSVVGSLDSLYYIGVSQWYTDATYWEDTSHEGVPKVGDPSPGEGTAYALDEGARIGVDLVLATVDVWLPGSPVDRFTTTLVAFMAALAGATVAAGRLLRWPAGVTWIAAGAQVAAAPFARQVAAQNLASVAAASLVVLAIASCLAYTSEREDERRRLRDLWLPGLLVAAVLACYPEYFALLVPGVLLMLAFSRRRVLGLRRWSAIALLTIALAPVALYRAVKYLLFLGEATGADAAWQASGLGTELGMHEIAAWVSGSVQTHGVVSGTAWTTGAVSAVLVIGLIAAIVLNSRRWFWVGLIAGSVMLCWNLISSERPYTLYRTFLLIGPLLVLASSQGWAELWERGRLTAWSKRMPFAVPVLGVTAGIVFLYFNVQSSRAIVRDGVGSWQRVRVDDEMRTVAAWVDRYGGDQGRGVGIAVLRERDNTFLATLVAQKPLVQFPLTAPSFSGRDTYWNSKLPRHMVVGEAIPLSADGAVVDRTSRFRLLDMGAGSAILAVPTTSISQWDAAEPQASALRAQSTPAQLAILRNNTAVSSIQLRVRREDAYPANRRVECTADGSPSTTLPRRVQEGWLTLQMPRGQEVMVVACGSNAESGEHAGFTVLGVRQSARVVPESKRRESNRTKR